MPHDLTHRRLTATPPATRDADGRPRFVVLRRRGPGRQRRGIVLIFVVVLLTLLAIMGTAYLATSRIDRQAITGRGALPGANTPLLPEQTTLTRVHAAAEARVKQAIIQDLFAVQDRQSVSATGYEYLKGNANAAYYLFRARTTTATANLYENYDAPGRADAWLSGLLPRKVQGNAPPAQQYYFWNWIGRPLSGGTSGVYFERFFSDPRALRTTGYQGTLRAVTYDPSDTNGIEATTAVNQRHAPAISSVQLTRSGSTDPTKFPSRVYPGLAFSNDSTGAVVLPTAGNTFIAGDADGDGIADSGLIPIQINPAANPVDGTSIDQYLDRTNGVVYFMSYRVVDNSAKLNLQTALTNFGDVVDTNVTSTGEAKDSNDELRHYLGADPTTIAANSGVFGPNYGFFRANVGLTGLLRTLLSPINPAAEAGTGYVPADAEIRRLIDVRFPFLRQSPGTNYDNDPTGAGIAAGRDLDKLSQNFASSAVAELNLGTAAGAPSNPAGFPISYQYRSFADLVEQQFTRRIESPGGYLWAVGTTAQPAVSSASLVSLGLGDTLSLSAKGGALINPLISTGSGEAALLFSTRLSTPNVNNNGAAPWSWFPPDAVDLWFGWTQDFESTDPDGTTTPVVIEALDAGTNAAPAPRAFEYSAAKFGTAKPAGLADVFLPRSPRALLTTYSGVTTQVPQRSDFGGATPGLPLGMLSYTSGGVRTAAPFNEVPGIWYPPAKVSAASGTKEQLWRAFWSAMTQQDAPSGRWIAAPRILPATAVGTIPAGDPRLEYDAFRSPDRYASVEGAPVAINGLQQVPNVMTSRQMALIRSAVAACNTVDLRDNDNDITAMTIDVTDNNATAAGDPRYYARVYGTEKQLVISSVYLENDGAPYVAVEIYNPTDVPIKLSAYRLSVMDRSTTPAPPTKLNGVITNLPVAGTRSIPLSTVPGDYIAPGGYMFISKAAPANPATMAPWPLVPYTAATTGTPEIWVNITDPNAATILDQLLLTNTGAQELVLTRTRRADGEAFVDGTAGAEPRNTLENEDTDDPRTLVPVDAVDCRLSVASTAGAPFRYIYQRQTPAPIPAAPAATPADPFAGANATEQAGAWRCFYAGKFYNLRSDPTLARSVSPTNTELIADGTYAWRDMSGPVPQIAVTFGETPLRRTWTGTSPAYSPVAAPAIPIQNFTPYDPFTVTNTRLAGAPPSPASSSSTYIPGGAPTPAMAGMYHLINKFPYGSPFARDGDLMAIPYIGTYKIYRAVGAAAPVLYEYVPLPMDAVNVAPEPASVTVTGVGGVEVKTVGRFDPREDPTMVTTWTLATNGVRNEWAASLTDFISARQAAYKPTFPDVPDASPESVGYTTAGGAAATDNHRRDQDGPVTGTAATANTFNDVPYTNFVTRSGPTDTTIPKDSITNSTVRRRGADTKVGTEPVTLQQGLINVNTAPSIVLRQLPWVINPATGLADYAVGSAAEYDQRAVVNEIVRRREELGLAPATTTPPLPPLNTPSQPGRQFGFGSLPTLSLVPQVNRTTTATAPNATSTTVLTATAPELMRLGNLNPLYRNEAAANYQIDNLNIARVSNLATTRSDVFTVYVTVQAWTWTGNDSNQPRDTRLVGERRSSFVVDRSRINQTQYDVSNLITLPIERE